MNTKNLHTVFSVLLLAGMIFSLAQPAQAQGPVAPEITLTSQAPAASGLQPKITYDVQHDLSAPLSEIAAAQQPEVGGGQVELPMFQLPKGQAIPLKSAEPDAALQNSPVTGSMPTLLANFDGVNNIASVAPPDTQGDIGYDPGTGNKYYMQWVNLHIQAWDVSDPTTPVALFAAPITGNSIWAGFGGRCETDNSGDPIVLYDELANRWMISQFAVSAAPYYNCMAISTTSDPSGAYYRYAFLYSNINMNDYPKYGVWPDGYYMTVNQFAASWAGAGVAVYERDQLLVGAAARQVIFDLYSVNANFGGMLPADFEGTPPPAGTPAYFAEVDDSSSGLGAVDEMRIWQFHTDWATDTYSFGLAGLPDQVLPVTDFTPICSGNRNCVPQPGVTQRLDAIGDRLMYRLAYRYLDDGTQRMVVNHTVDAGSARAAVRWYELQTTTNTWAITQQGTYAGDVPATDTTHRWMGSISMDRMGNIALGYSMSSGTVYPSLGLVGRLETDPANTLPQAEVVAFSGTASQSGVNRWGDYSSMSIDPEDGCTFWYTQEYSSGGWDWRTRIVSFKYPSCTALPTGTLQGVATDVSTTLPLEGVQITAGAFTTYTDASGFYSLVLPENTYTVTTSLYGYLPQTATVMIVSTLTTVQDFNLSAATMRTGHFYVYDVTSSGHTWPLYARITLASYPGGDLYTDPQNGYVSVQLPEGFTFPVTVNAVSPGYNSVSGSISIPPLDFTVYVYLDVDLSLCTAPGYAMVGGFAENFDSTTPPALPANWANVTLSGSPSWATRVGTRYPSGNPAFSPPNLAFFNSWSYSSGSARLYYTHPLDMTAIAPDQMTFQMFHDMGYSTYHDMLQPVVSTDSGATWIPVGPAFDRVGTLGWQLHTVDLSAYSASTNLLIGFNATSAFGNDIHIDDVLVGVAPACTRQDGGLLMGNVYDANTILPLNDATITLPVGDPLTTASTPDDPALADGFYYGFVPLANTSATASLPLYSSDTQSLSITDNGTFWLDFILGAPELSYAPTSFSVSLQMNASTLRTMTITDIGTSALDYEIMEVNLPPVVITLDPDPDPSMRHLGPKNFDKTSLEGVPYYLTPARDAPQFEINAAGDLISSFASGLTGAWGLGVDQFASNVWVGSISATGGDDLNYEFSPAGVATGNTIDTSAWVGVFAADMTYDPVNYSLWQVNAGGDNCIYEMDLLTYAATGNKICPAFSTSQRGLAYDPASDTFFSGSWNDSLIIRFNRAGVILQQVDVGLAIAGLAYNPFTGHLFVTSNNTGTFDVNVLDVYDSYADLGGFNVAALGDYQQAGLEFACDGHLWAVNQTTNDALEIDSGETGICDYSQIPWLAEAPVQGWGLPAGDSQDIDLTFDATGVLPGTYAAQLHLKNNSPYMAARVPVTLIVSLAPGYGTVNGKVSDLGYCDANPAPLEGATVEIRNNASTLVATLTTDALGLYSWSGPVTGNNYSITVSKAGTSGGSATVTLASLSTITQDFNVRTLTACLGAVPTPLETTVLLNGTDSKTMVLSNTGAAGTNFNIIEIPTTLSPSISPLINLVTEGFEGATFPPSGWTQNVANAGYTWVQSNLGFHTGAYGANVFYDPALVPQDEWLLTPEYAISDGTLSFWSEGSLYWCRDTYDNCDLKIWLVVGAVGGGDDVFVDTVDDAWAANYTWAQSTYVLDALLPGVPVKIGFQYTGTDGAQIAIDDILLDGTVGIDVPWLAETPISGYLNPDTGSVNIAVDFDATGLALGDYHAILRTTDDFTHTLDVPVTLHVVNNTPPVAVNDSYTTNEDTPKTVSAPGVLGNDTDAESDPLTATKVTDPAHGTLTLNANGSFTYTPAANWNGTDSFTYKANDGTADSNIATVTLNVTAVNDPPVAVNDSYTTAEDTPKTVAAPGVLGNDTDVEGSALTAIKVTDPAHGTVTLNANGSFTYTPAANWNGTDSFTYKANDGSTSSSTNATVTLNVTAVNDPPVAVNDSYTTNEDTSKTVAAPGVLGNDTDVEGDPLTTVLNTNVSHGTLTLNANGSFTYTPAANWNGTDSFTYKANDGTADSNVATVTLNVTAVNDPPVAVNDSTTTAEDTPKTVAAPGVLSNDTDVEGSALTAIKVTNPAHGTVTLNANGSFTYTPAANWNGTDSFTYKANDGTVDSNIATVSINVTAVNDVPVANAQSVSTTEDTAKAVTLTATDPDDITFTWTIVTPPAHGALSGTAPNVTYTPTANYNGADSFTFKVNDGDVDSNIATVSINVTAVNDPPVAVNNSYTTAEDTPKTVVAPGVLGNDTDVEGSALTAIKVTDPAHGSLTLNTNGSFTYTPAANWNGADSFTYKASDGTADSNVATVTLNVTAVNDPPVANGQSVSTLQDTPKAITLTAADVESSPLTWTIVANPAHGALSGTAPNVTYTPAAGWSGTDTFTFKVNDGTVDSNTATVTITVTAVNAAPVAVNDDYNMEEDTVLSIAVPGVLGNDTDAESDPLTAVQVTGPAHGTLTLNANGSFTYTPDANWYGTDTFTYVANDGIADSNVATVTIDVADVPETQYIYLPLIRR